MMKSLLRPTVPLALLLSLVLTCLAPRLSMASTSHSVITGIVFSAATSQPIFGAKVSTLNQSYTTGSNGKFIFFLPAGHYAFTATAQGYKHKNPDEEEYKYFVDIENGSVRSFNFSLHPLPLQSVTPNWGEIGTDLEVSIKGTGFDENTRMAMYLDAGNQMEIKPITIISNTELEVTLPSPQVTGSYTLRVFNATQSNELPGAVTFSAKGQKKHPKAIIVAGGGNQTSNLLWEVTKRNAHAAYKALVEQGFDKKNIKLFSDEANDHTLIDVDENGLFDDELYPPILDQVEDAVTNWAKDGDALILYLVDHGDNKKNFFLDLTLPFPEGTLSANQLAGWLNTLQATMRGRVIVVNEFCYAGSFVKPLMVPEGSNFQRVTITSSSALENTLMEGENTFGYKFWEKISNGKTVGETFTEAQKMVLNWQHPWLDGNGNGIANEPNEGNLSRHLGTYQVSYYITGFAKDRNGADMEVPSLPMSSTVVTGSGVDKYEPDNSPEEASTIILNTSTAQRHSFYEPGDKDWVKFYGIENETYTLEAKKLGSNNDVQIDLFNDSTFGVVISV